MEKAFMAFYWLSLTHLDLKANKQIPGSSYMTDITASHHTTVWTRTWIYNMEF